MWSVKASKNKSSPYAVTDGYDPDARLVPLATNPPPLPVEKKRVKTQSPKAALAPRSVKKETFSGGSPYAVRADYDASLRMIPTSAPPPLRADPVPVRRPQPTVMPGRRGPQPPMAPPPMHMMYAPPPLVPQKRSYAQAMPQPPVYAEPLPEQLEPPAPPLRITLPSTAQFVADGMDENGAAIYFDSRLSTVTCSTSYILSDLVDDVATDVTITHDADWEEFPEVGEALVEAGGEQNAMCVAFCPTAGAWGVGIGGKWQKRENIAKLALCVSLVDKSEKADAIFQQHPEFADFCSVPGQRRKKARKVAPKAKTALKPVKAERAAPPKPVVKMPPAAAASDSLPRDTPIWIKLPADELMPDQLDGMLPEALAVSTDGTKRKALYANAEKVLADLVGDPENDIEYHDDFDWKNFPTVGAALKEIADKEECLCVAVCRSQSTWAVGVGMKGGPRWKAAKVAIAATILWQAQDSGEDFSQMENTSFLEFAEEVRQAREDMGW